MICLVLGLALAAFAYWGMETSGGRSAYDEMDGLYPLCAAALAGVLLLTPAALLLSRRRS